MHLTKKRLKTPSPRIALQADFFSRLTLAHLARWAAAILRRADTDIVRLGFVIGTTLLFPLTLAQRALCAAAIRARPLADIL